MGTNEESNRRVTPMRALPGRSRQAAPDANGILIAFI